MATVDRVADILITLLTTERVSIAELSNLTGYPSSSLYRIISRLVLRGLVIRRPGGVYSLGTIFLRYNEPEDINKFRELAKPFVDELSKETGESVNVVIYQGTKAINIILIHVIHKTRMITYNLTELPLHCTANGKILLANLDPGQLNSVMEATKLYNFTKNTITKRDKLMEDLSKIKNTGIAIDHEEYELGIISIGSPIRSFQGNVIASSAILCPPQRLTDARKKKLVTMVKKCTADISRALGYKNNIHVNSMR